MYEQVKPEKQARHLGPYKQTDHSECTVNNIILRQLPDDEIGRRPHSSNPPSISLQLLPSPSPLVPKVFSACMFYSKARKPGSDVRLFEL